MSSKRATIGSAYACAAIASLSAPLALGEWALTIFLWAFLAATWILLERGRLRHPPDWFSKHVVTLPIVAFVYVDFRVFTTPLMSAIAHLLLLLQVAKAVKRKTPGDLWTMYFVTLLQMLVGSVVSLDVLFFGLWGAYILASLFFLNLVLTLHPRGDFPVAVHVPPGRSLIGRLARLTMPLAFLVGLGTSIAFFFFPRDFGGLRQALSLRRNSERLAWSAGIMIPDGGGAAASGLSENVDIGSLASLVLDPTEALDVKFSKRGQPFRPDPDQVYLRARALLKFDGRRWTSDKAPPEPRRGRDHSEAWKRGMVRMDEIVEAQVKPLADQGPMLVLPRPLLRVGVDWIYADDHGNLTRDHLLHMPYTGSCWWRPWERPDLKPAGTWWTHDLIESPFSAHAKEYEDLAEEITKGLPRTAHERAQAISKWLSDNCEYTLQMEWQSNSDPVHEFLRRRRGYCVYFASAMAVLLRALRIPCRLAAGYAGGRFDEARGAYVIRRSDAHAWVEIPYDNGFWVPYDPTAAARIAQTRTDTLAVPWWTSARDSLDRQLLFYDAGRQRELIDAAARFANAAATTTAGWIAMASALLLLAGYAVAAARRRARLEQAIRARGPVPIPTWPAIDYYAEMLRLLRRAGIERAAHVTPREFAAGLPPPARTITEMFEDERYGGRAADVAAARQALGELRESLA